MGAILPNFRSNIVIFFGLCWWENQTICLSVPKLKKKKKKKHHKSRHMNVYNVNVKPPGVAIHLWKNMGIPILNWLPVSSIRSVGISRM